MYDEAVKIFWPCHLYQFRRQEAQEDRHGQNVRIEVKMSGLRFCGKYVLNSLTESPAWSKCQDWGEIVRNEVLLLLFLLFIVEKNFTPVSRSPLAFIWFQEHLTSNLAPFNHPSHFSEITFMTLIQYNRWTAASWDNLSRRQEQIDTLPKPEEK